METLSSPSLDLRTRRLLCIWEDASKRAARSDKDSDWRHVGVLGMAVIEKLREQGVIEDVDLVPLDPDTSRNVTGHTNGHALSRTVTTGGAHES